MRPLTEGGVHVWMYCDMRLVSDCAAVSSRAHGFGMLPLGVLPKLRVSSTPPPLVAEAWPRSNSSNGDSVTPAGSVNEACEGNWKIGCVRMPVAFLLTLMPASLASKTLFPLTSNTV